MAADDPINIAYLNETSGVTDATLASYVAAYQEDFGQHASEWGLGRITCKQIPKGDPAPSGWWQQIWLDNADQANALGYHDVTIEGLPLGKVFDLTTRRDGQTSSRVGSHEGWEQVCDPWLNRYTTDWALAYCIEVGDLLSLDSQGRDGLGGVRLSGIALPATYFKNYGPRYDIGGVLTAGYPDVAPADGAYEMWQGGAGWGNQGAAAAKVPHFFRSPAILSPDDFMHFQAQHRSRRHRRIIGQANWRPSTVAVAA